MLPKFEAIISIEGGPRRVGFDPGKPYDWFMVPLNERKDIALMNAENVKLTSENPLIAEVVGNVPLIAGPINRRLTIHGKQKGRTFIFLHHFCPRAGGRFAVPQTRSKTWRGNIRLSRLCAGKT